MSSKLRETLQNNDLILMEGAVIEILRRSGKVVFQSGLIHSHLIYDAEGVEQLSSIFKSYIAVAKKSDVPYIMCTPTWRANKTNVENAAVKSSINVDAAELMHQLRQASGAMADNIIIGGTIGPKNDCYSPELGLSADDAEAFHSWQIEELVRGGVDFVIAETVPSVDEALGMAEAAAKQHIDCIISFVISRDGRVLDGTSLLDAIRRIDDTASRPPLGYSISCAYPTFLCAEHQPKEIFDRLIAFKGNASSLDHAQLENADCIHSDDIADWGDEMLKLNRDYGVKILGGCCGTDAEHLEYLITN